MGKIFSGLTSKPKATKIAPPKPVAPPPVETVDQAGDQIKKKKKPTGRASTFLTGDLVPDQTKKTTLG